MSEADWIGPRLAPFGDGRVISVVPAAFAAYARILHPVTARDRTVRWTEVATWSGASLGPGTQFHDIALPEHEPQAPAPWDSQGPWEGSLTGADAATLVAILRGHTATPGECWFCVWEGYGGDNAALFTAATVTRPTAARPQALGPGPAAVQDAPRVRLPGRDYLLSTGSIADAPACVDDHGQTPSLWWPADRAWCVASEIDLPFTYLAGPAALIDQVMAEHRLEALPAHPDDSHHLRVTGWLAERIDMAVATLLTDGETVITTSRGTVWAGLQHPSRWRSGWLRTHTEGRNGVTGSGRTRLNRHHDEELRRALHLDLMAAVTGLVNN